jgi:hypothetical protein
MVMKLYTYYDDTYYPLFENLLSTIQDDYEIKAMKTDLIGTSSYRHAIHKPLLVEQAIKENMGDVIIISDSDVQFFGKTQDLVEKLITTKEILVQWCGVKDYNEINIGFMAIRCCPRMANLWRQIRIDVQREQLHDEYVTNCYLKADKDIPWAFFPKTIWADDGENPPDDIILQHAIGVGVGTTDSVERKLQRMQKLWGDKPKHSAKPYAVMDVPQTKTPKLFHKS